ncbi:hypothetical protein GGX14DRAFT_634097 [Mycena pura]|uniref:F-box domain-containing protein n=1 Tax=Mycena pura TaxID=153505 RepID=A0AAD6YC38_9AGAR|nr:hypothetical protein GGX14DRAFT_634097 [Mycena pura]
MAIVCENSKHRNGGTTSIDSITELRGHDTSADQRAALAKLEAEIVQFKTYAEGHLAALEEKRRSILHCLDGVVYPILTLPTEITSKIFMQCLPDHGRVRPSPRRAPLVLTRICGQWRAIALSTGELWSSLDVDIGVLWPGRDDLLRSWFPRAKDYPLSLTIRRSKYGQTYTGSLSAHVAAIIPKLRRLEAKVSDGQFRNLVPLGTSLPLLRSFAATLSSENLQNILHSAPNLRELRARLPAPNFHVASKSLLSLDIAEEIYSIDAFLGILENCPLLSHLKISVRVDRDHNKPTPITYPYLRSLTFTQTYGERALDFVTLPNLTHLGGIYDMTPDIFQPFLSRSSCVIKYFACSSHPAPEYMEPALRMFPWLETLQLTVPGEVVTLTPVLLWLDPDRMLAPQLRHITIEFHPIERTDFSLIVDVLKRRRDLQSLRVIGAEPAEEEDTYPWWLPGPTAAAELLALRALGVNFSANIWMYYHEGTPSVEVWPNSEKVDPYEDFELRL